MRYTTASSDNTTLPRRKAGKRRRFIKTSAFLLAVIAFLSAFSVFTLTSSAQTVRDAAPLPAYTYRASAVKAGRSVDSISGKAPKSYNNGFSVQYTSGILFWKKYYTRYCIDFSRVFTLLRRGVSQDELTMYRLMAWSIKQIKSSLFSYVKGMLDGTLRSIFFGMFNVSFYEADETVGLINELYQKFSDYPATEEFYLIIDVETDSRGNVKSKSNTLGKLCTSYKEMIDEVGTTFGRNVSETELREVLRKTDFPTSYSFLEMTCSWL